MKKLLLKFFRARFLVQVNYKTGTKMRFWVYSFEVTGGTHYKWESCNSRRPVQLGADDIESVWQIRIKKWYYLW